jgi:hypothetical protein
MYEEGTKQVEKTSVFSSRLLRLRLLLLLLWWLLLFFLAFAWFDL